MRSCLKFYIDGAWVDSESAETLEVENPANQQVIGRIALGSTADVDKAVAAARRAFTDWSSTTRPRTS